MPTKAQLRRTMMRQQLYTGCTRVRGGRGGSVILESRLLQMWPEYLDMEHVAAKPVLTLADVAAMHKQKQTPQFNDFPPRRLSCQELATIGQWHDKAKAAEQDSIGAAVVEATLRKRVFELEKEIARLQEEEEREHREDSELLNKLNETCVECHTLQEKISKAQEECDKLDGRLDLFNTRGGHGVEGKRHRS